MTVRFTATCLIALGLVACDDGETGPRATTKMQIANPYQERLIKLSVLNRSLGLRRAIQDAGQGCARITATGYQGPHRQLHMWVGRCDPQGDYAVFIAPNGDAQVRKCADAKALKLPECKREPLDPVPRITAG